MTFQKLDPAIRDLAKGVNFGTLSFMLPSGRIASHVMWVDADDDHILINTDLGRIKYDSIKANPLVTVAMWKADNAYAYGLPVYRTAHASMWSRASWPATSATQRPRTSAYA